MGDALESMTGIGATHMRSRRHNARPSGFHTPALVVLLVTSCDSGEITLDDPSDAAGGSAAATGGSQTGVDTCQATPAPVPAP